MDSAQRSHLQNWTYLYQDKCMDELRQSLVLTMELEETRVKAQEELRTRDEQISHLKELLTKALKERDEAQVKCQKVLLEKLVLQQQLQQSSGVSSIEDDPRGGTKNNSNNNNKNNNNKNNNDKNKNKDSNVNGFSSSDSDESIVSSPYEADFPLAIDRPLPEKGKLLQAVMKAGPLLQSLLVAGPLPQWRHPPPPIDAYQIPPPPLVIPSPPQPAIANINCRKRGLAEGSDSSIELKYQRTILQ